MTHKYKVGDRVILSAVGIDRYNEVDNPRNTLGVIDSYYDDEEFEFHVTWSNGELNTYSHDDLQVIQC